MRRSIATVSKGSRATPKPPPPPPIHESVCTVRPATVGVPRLRLLRSYRAARSVACFFSSVSTFRMYACRRGPSKDPSGRCSRTSVGAADAPARHLSQRIAFELFNVELQLFDVIGQDRHFLALIAQLVRCNTPLARCQKYTRPTRSGLCSPSRSETDRGCARAWLGASSTLACRGIATFGERGDLLVGELVLAELPRHQHALFLQHRTHVPARQCICARQVMSTPVPCNRFCSRRT